MSFIYPRTIAITRPADQTGAGVRTGYAGVNKATETPVASGLPASIQARREGQANPTGLPADATTPRFYIFIPKRACARGTIRVNDIITDDLGDRYQTLDAYWDSLGYRPTCLQLKS